MSGTSMASPHVTGAVAVIRQANPNLDVDAVKEILILSSTDLETLRGQRYEMASLIFTQRCRLRLMFWLCEAI